MRSQGYSDDWIEATGAYLALAVDRLANRGSSLCIWNMPAEKIEQTFARFALPILWDFAESNPLAGASGNYRGEIDWISSVCQNLYKATNSAQTATVRLCSAKQLVENDIDLVVTDPPYYDAIPYSDLMDFFYVWLRRTLCGISSEIDEAFREVLAPKWDHEKRDGELIDDSSRFGGDKSQSKASYEAGMATAFETCHKALSPDGRMVIVFAHKQPDAWEALVSAIIRAGFVVDGSWPIQTERSGRMRATASAALSASVWLVCKKRPETARLGWDNRVIEEMRENISTRLRAFWDEGLRGPDFVWAATGPALEAFSKYPVVKKANEPGQLMTVSEFLRHVRRIVVDFVVGRVLSHNGDAEAVVGLDDVTTYYLLHRHDFGLDEAPAGACILYAVSCGLSDQALADRYDILVRTGGRDPIADEDETTSDDISEEQEEGSGSKVKLKPWHLRKRAGMEHESASTRLRASITAAMTPMLPELEQPALSIREIPLIDQIHRLMHLWKAGDVIEVDEYIDARGLRGSHLFQQLLQALIELSLAGSEERALLESISNHIGTRGFSPKNSQTSFDRIQTEH